jgi:hypothetical protein
MKPYGCDLRGKVKKAYWSNEKVYGVRVGARAHSKHYTRKELANLDRK